MKISKIWSTACQEYRKWLINEKQIVTAICLVFLHVMIVEPYLRRAEEMGTYPNFVEPFLAVANSKMFLLVLPLVFLVLISDCPRMDGDFLFFLARAGKRNWIMGQVCFLLMASCSYLGVILFYTFIFGGAYGFAGNAWSLAVLNFKDFFGTSVPEYISSDLYWQMSPYGACVKGCILLVGYFLLVGMLLLVFAVYDKKKTGMMVIAGILAVGTGAAALDAPAAWCFPTAHAILGKHFQGMLREVRMEFGISVAYEASAIILLFLFAYIGMKRRAFYAVDGTEE